MRSTRSGLDALAWLTSAVLSPFVVFVVLIGIFISRAAVETEHFLYWSAITLILTASIPAFFIFWQVRRGKISDPHIEKREQRQSVFDVFIISLLLGMLVLWKFGAPHSFVVLTMLIFVNSLLAGIITRYWKISIHSWVLAGAITIGGLVFALPTWFWWTFLSVPLVIWARVYRGRHTLWQGLAGALAGVVLTMLLYQILVRP
jgi:hypothetical protein